MSRQIKKLSKELTDYTFVDDIARANIDVISDSLNDLEIPDKTSDLTNDSGFITSDNIKTINNQSIIGSGNITIQGGDGGGTTIVEITSDDYKELTEEQKNDPNILYVISDGISEYYKKEESDNRYALKGEGKTYTGASGVTVNNATNTIGVNAVSSVTTANSTNYLTFQRTSTTGTSTTTICNLRKLQANGTIQNPTGTTLINLDDIYPTKTGFKTINNETILGSGNITITPNNEWVGTQEQYDALATKDPNITYYII